MKHTIWSNLNLDVNDWKDSIIENWKENNSGTPTDEEIYEEMLFLNGEYLEDERCNLSIQTENRIITIADLGLWNGRKIGYKLTDKRNVNECLSIYDDCDYAEIYCDRYDVRSKQIHHDGTNYYLYREIKPNITDWQLQNFCTKLYNGTVTSQDISKYTRSLMPYLKKAYGW